MEIITFLLEFVKHPDIILTQIVQNYGTQTYLFLFCVIFAETGLVITPFLPGDSLLFAVGAIAAIGSLNVHFIVLLLIIAALTGDSTNFWIGRFLGPKVYERDSKILKKKYLDKTQEFYKKHGGKTTIMARFVPIVRTFAPFVAGVGAMKYPRFITFSIIGGIAWVGSFIYLGYFFGNIPIIKKNFSIVVIVIILMSIMPMVVEVIRHKMKKK